MQAVFVVIHLVLAIAVIGLILIQHGKGADAGAAFGSGASATVFGAQGSGSFLSRLTAILATLFFITSVTLAAFALQTAPKKSFMEAEEAETAAESVVSEEVRQSGTAAESDIPVGVGGGSEAAGGMSSDGSDIPAGVGIQEEVIEVVPASDADSGPAETEASLTEAAGMAQDIVESVEATDVTGNAPNAAETDADSAAATVETAGDAVQQ